MKAEDIFSEMEEAVTAIGPDLKKKFTGIVKFDIAEVGTWTLNLKTGNGSVSKGDGGAKPDLVIRVNEEDFSSLYDGKLNAQQAFMKGKLKIKGNMSLAMKFNTVLTATRKQLEKSRAGSSGGAKKAAAGGSKAPAAAAAAGGGGVPKATAIFQLIEDGVAQQGPDLVKKMKGAIQFDIDGEKWFVNLKTGNGTVTKGQGPSPDLTVTMSDNDFADIHMGKLNSQQAFMKGKIKLKGNMQLAMKLNTVLAAARPKARM